MDKTVLNFKGIWKGMNIIAYRSIGNLKSEFSPYEFYDGEFVRIIDGHPQFIDRVEIVKQQLTMGRGVYFNGYIMFFEKTEGHKKFKKAFKKTKDEYEQFLNGIVCKHIFDYYNIPVVKFILSMYKNGIYSEIIVRQKLSIYIPQDAITEVFEEFEKETIKESA